MTKQLNNEYLQGYAEGLDVISHQIKRLVHGANTYDQVMSILNGIIVALNDEKAKLAQLKYSQDAQNEPEKENN